MIATTAAAAKCHPSAASPQEPAALPKRDADKWAKRIKANGVQGP